MRRHLVRFGHPEGRFGRNRANRHCLPPSSLADFQRSFFATTSRREAKTRLHFSPVKRAISPSDSHPEITKKD
jgi:hypothetical protein